MSRVEADALRLELGEYVGWLMNKYSITYQDAQAINDLAYKIVLTLEDEGVR